MKKIEITNKELLSLNSELPVIIGLFSKYVDYKKILSLGKIRSKIRRMSEDLEDNIEALKTARFLELENERQKTLKSIFEAFNKKDIENPSNHLIEQELLKKWPDFVEWIELKEHIDKTAKSIYREKVSIELEDGLSDSDFPVFEPKKEKDKEVMQRKSEDFLKQLAPIAESVNLLCL